MPNHPFTPSPHHSRSPPLHSMYDGSPSTRKRSQFKQPPLQINHSNGVRAAKTDKDFSPETAERRTAMFRHCCCIFSCAIKQLIFIFHDSQDIKCHEWVTFVSNTLSEPRQRRCMCLGFFFKSGGVSHPIFKVQSQFCQMFSEVCFSRHPGRLQLQRTAVRNCGRACPFRGAQVSGSSTACELEVAPLAWHHQSVNT